MYLVEIRMLSLCKSSWGVGEGGIWILCYYFWAFSWLHDRIGEK